MNSPTFDETHSLIKNCEESEILLCFQSYKLSLYSSIDAGRGHKTPDQRQRMVYCSQQQLQWKYYVCVASSTPNSQNEMQRGLDDTCTGSGVHYRSRILIAGIPKSLILGSNYACSLFWRKTLALSSKAIHYISILERTVSGSAHEMCKYSLDPWRTPTQHLQSIHFFALFNFSSSFFHLPIGKI